jgi:biofilm PGA synthesis protein PgaA
MARGWPRRAEAEAQIAASLDPDGLGPKIVLAELARADFRFADTRREASDLMALYPEDSGVQRLARELGADQRWTFETEARPSDSSGGGANASGQAWSVRSSLLTPPVADHWQLFARQDYADAHPPEGFVGWSRVSVGVTWRDPDVRMSLYASPAWGSFGKTGAGGTLDWSASDQVRLAFAAERYSWETPLRAVLHGISADSLSASATYRWSESRSLSGTVAYMPFSDGNQRLAAGAIFTDRLVDAPHFDLSATGEVYTSRNDRPEAPYFNPDEDLTLQAGLSAEHVLWRRYDVVLTQALSVSAGLYAQAHHAGDVIATVGYEHRWRVDPYLDFHYGVQISRRVYDSDVENTAALTLGLRGRF